MPETTTAVSDDNVWHIVGNLQHLKARAGMKYRSLCGLQLELDSEAAYPTDDAPACPTCTAKSPTTTRR